MGNDTIFRLFPLLFGCSFVVIFLVSTVFFVWIVIRIATAGSGKRKDRLRQLAAWAYQNKLRFNPGPEWQFRADYRDFPQLPAGNAEHYAANVMRGRVGGRDVVCFDYHYVTKNDDDTTHWEFSALILDAGAPLKKLSIRPENLLDRAAALVGLNDIDFESAEFSRLFAVRCEDRKWAYDVIGQPMMEYMLARPRYVVQMLGTRVLVTDQSLWDSDQFDRALRYGQGLLELIPASVLDELKGVDR